MTARIHVHGCFHLQLRALFVVHGAVMDGRATVGSYVWNVPGLDQPVDALESVLLSATTGESTTGVCFRYRDEAELHRWQAATLTCEVLELREPNEPQPNPLGVGAVIWSDGKRRDPPTRPGFYPRSSE